MWCTQDHGGFPIDHLIGSLNKRSYVWTGTMAQIIAADGSSFAQVRSSCKALQNTVNSTAVGCHNNVLTVFFTPASPLTLLPLACIWHCSGGGTVHRQHHIGPLLWWHHCCPGQPRLHQVHNRSRCLVSPQKSAAMRHAQDSHAAFVDACDLDFYQPIMVQHMPSTCIV